MKKLFTAALIIFTTAAHSQSAKVSSAYIDLGKGRLKEAFENIEAAIQDPKTSVEAKTWKYRFDILMAIALSNNIDYRSLVNQEDLIPTLNTTYNKIVELDKKNQYLDKTRKDIATYMVLFTKSAYQTFEAADKVTDFKNFLKKNNLVTGPDNKVNVEAMTSQLDAIRSHADSLIRKPVSKCLDGDKAASYKCLEDLEKGAYNTAMGAFAFAAEIAKIANTIDTVGYYNAALAADRAGQKEAAIELYKEALKYNYRTDENIHRYIADLHRELGDTLSAINIIKEGRKAFPGNFNLIIDELNYYLKKGDFAEAEKTIQVAIQQDPSNDQLYNALGNSYENLKKFAEAKAAYEKAMAINPANFTATFNLGAMIFNEGVELSDQANKLDVRSKAAQIDELNKKADAKFRAALPVFEKALTLQPSDHDLLTRLKQLYARLEMMDKYDEIKKKLEGK